MLPATGGRKRGREDDDDDAAAVRAEDGLYGKVCIYLTWPLGPC